jgi:hypothetical protein
MITSWNWTNERYKYNLLFWNAVKSENNPRVDEISNEDPWKSQTNAVGGNLRLFWVTDEWKIEFCENKIKSMTKEQSTNE